jgi:hypothetical protein
VARGTPVDLQRRLGEGEGATGPRGERQLARQSEVEGVDGLDAQRTRILQKVPAAGRGVPQRRLGQLLESCGARIGGRRGTGERARDPRAHFRGGLEGEGDGENLVRIVHRAQKAQEALGEHGGLAGAGRRLQQDRAVRIDRLAARLSISGQQLFTEHRGCPRAQVQRRS